MVPLNTAPRNSRMIMMVEDWVKPTESRKGLISTRLKPTTENV